MKDLLFQQIKVLSNKHRYTIVKLTQEKKLTISEISQQLRLSYNKCADYISMLEKVDLISKLKEGKNVFVKSKITLKTIVET